MELEKENLALAAGEEEEEEKEEIFVYCTPRGGTPPPVPFWRSFTFHSRAPPKRSASRHGTHFHSQKARVLLRGTHSHFLVSRKRKKLYNLCE